MEKCKIKPGWGDAGKTGTVLGKNIFVEQLWTPVKWDDEEDPDWFKSSGLMFFEENHHEIQNKEGGKIDMANKRIENNHIGLRCGEARVLCGGGNHIRVQLQLGKRVFSWRAPYELQRLAKTRHLSFLGLGRWCSYMGHNERYFCLATCDGNLTYIDCDAVGELLALAGKEKEEK